MGGVREEEGTAAPGLYGVTCHLSELFGERPIQIITVPSFDQQKHRNMSFCQFLSGEIYKDHFKPGEQAVTQQAVM